VSDLTAGWSFETKQEHAGATSDPTTWARATPMSGEEQLATGVGQGLVRLSVGLEGIEDLKADLDAGFRAAKGA
jgi:O-acetylhomoserine/O-acetylserine sulfhydrylase-like pyridoxal-dependent enzyme